MSFEITNQSVHKPNIHETLKNHFTHFLIRNKQSWIISFSKNSLYIFSLLLQLLKNVFITRYKEKYPKSSLIYFTNIQISIFCIHIFE